jgi:hypothetical protein
MASMSLVKIGHSLREDPDSLTGSEISSRFHGAIRVLAQID